MFASLRLYKLSDRCEILSSFIFASSFYFLLSSISSFPSLTFVHPVLVLLSFSSHLYILSNRCESLSSSLFSSSFPPLLHLPFHLLTLAHVHPVLSLSSSSHLYILSVRYPLLLSLVSLLIPPFLHLPFHSLTLTFVHLVLALSASSLHLHILSAWYSFPLLSSGSLLLPSTSHCTR